MPASKSSHRKSSKKANAGHIKPTSSGSSSRRSKKTLQNKDFNTTGSDHRDQGADEDMDTAADETAREAPPDGSDEETNTRSDDGDDAGMNEDDPFASGLLGRMAGSSSISNTLRALDGIMSGVTGRMRGILENLKMRDDPSIQLIALSELSELLLISNEDNLAGHFSPDQFVKQLILLMQPNDFGEENPEMMLLACRCIANLMEAIPSSTASVVYGGAVPVLCQKLLEIHYIDLAEQALSTLEKISVEFPSSIVREGGLTACLTFLDFFATSTQRTAVTTAANCCRGIPEESFPVIRDVMPILLNVLASSDQKVVEQGSLCVCRIIDSFRWRDEKVDELISEDLLKAILRLLLPGTTNLIGANIHTQYLRVLAISARASPRISVELLRLNVVDTLYQILTGISPPSGFENIAARIDKNVIMQALIRSPKDQVFETLNVACEVLPAAPDSLYKVHELSQIAGTVASAVAPVTTRTQSSSDDKRLKLFQESPLEVRRFAIILFPTLMHAYTSTVNLSVRQKVLSAQLKMLSNFDSSVVEEALEDIPFASHIASILTQQENPLLVTCALQIAEVLITRLDHIYRFQFHREGVIAEIKKLAERPYNSEMTANEHQVQSENLPVSTNATVVPSSAIPNEEKASVDDDGANEEHDEGDDDDDDIDGGDANDDDDDDSETSSEPPRPEHDISSQTYSSVQDLVTGRARHLVSSVLGPKSNTIAKEASATVDELRDLGRQLKAAYSKGDNVVGEALFQRLASYFLSAGTDGITSYELLQSDTVETLLILLSDDAPFQAKHDAHTAFVRAFMVVSPSKNSELRVTAFSVLLHKLQDLLSRTEHFEVITVHQNAFENSRTSATSMLAKQLRLRLSADEDSGIPRAYRNIMVSIHAIATFKALDEYLRPRISLAEQPDLRRARRSLLGAALGLNQDNAEQSESTSAQPAAPSRAKDANAIEDRPTTNASSARTLEQPLQTPSSRARQTHRTSGGEGGNVSTPSPSRQRSEAGEGSPLECADEEKLSDGDTSPEAGLDTVLDTLNDELEDHDEDEDASAVNLEVAKSGKVEARREDGTRIATPQSSQGPPAAPFPALSASARLAAARELLSSPSGGSRPRSYASAVQSTPQDWHIEFSINGQTVSNDTTIYRAVHFNQAEPEEVSGRVVWSAVHKITFKKVAGPPPPESQLFTQNPQSPKDPFTGLPVSLSHHPRTASILQLMSLLHHTNSELDDISLADANLEEVQFTKEPLAHFINTKLTAKLNRQLEEPLIVASNCLPSWSEDLARLYPFLFPFESRHLFLQSTSFGYSRSMARWQHGQTESQSRRHREERPFLGRTQRQKVRISRSRILESALRVMELYGHTPSILEVEYFEEVGTGLGPTLEFFATISKEFSKKKLKLWRENESTTDGEFAFGSNGLFPAPMAVSDTIGGRKFNDNEKKVLHLFKLLGTFVARSMMDSRIIDISFNPLFFRLGLSTDVSPTLAMVALVDKSLASVVRSFLPLISAKQKIDQDQGLTPAQKLAAYKEVTLRGTPIEDLGLDFTLPGYPHIELLPGGSAKSLTLDNLEQWVKSVIHATVGAGIRPQIEAFKIGFTQVFPYSALKAFTPDELVMLFGQTEEDWSLETLMDSIKADHGFNLDSKSVRNLLQTISEYSPTERRDFLQFVTGSPKLPIGGEFSRVSA